MPPKRNIGKSKRKKQKKKNKNSAAAAAAHGLPTPRIAIGTRVECKMSTGKYDTGQVVAHHWKHPAWPEGRTAPYQVRLDTGMFIFVPIDSDHIIRPIGTKASPLRFKPGTRVLCKVQGKTQTTFDWVPGVIVAQNYPMPQNPHMMMPYQIKLDSQKLIFAPLDTDDFIKHDPTRESEDVEAITAVSPSSERRFKIGARVMCKVHPEPNERWEAGEVQSVNVTHPSNAQVVLPYQIKLDNGTTIYAPADIDDVIKSLDTSQLAPKPEGRRFKVGDQVLCKMSPTKELWRGGKIIAINVSHTAGTQTVQIPYQVELNDGQQIYAPIDRDEIIKKYDASLDSSLQKESVKPKAEPAPDDIEELD